MTTNSPSHPSSHTPISPHVLTTKHNPEALPSKQAPGTASSDKTFPQITSFGEIELDNFSDYTDFLTEQQTASEKGIVTDRFIPTRRSLSYPPGIEQEESNNLKKVNESENTPPPPTDPSSLSLAEIYKKCIMTCPKKSIKLDTVIEEFRNNNTLKYYNPISNGNNHPTVNKILAQKSPEQLMENNHHEELDFTSELVQSIKMKRKLSKMPYKVLDAPALQDDFYLNLIDWGHQNFLAVGLASNVYLWNGLTSKVTKLCDLGLSDSVTSVGWSLKDNYFTLGTNNGEVHLWDIQKLKKVRVMHGHTNRVSSIAWNSSLLSTGSRDKTILNRDIRCSNSYISKLQGHKQEICGLKWSFD